MCYPIFLPRECELTSLFVLQVTQANVARGSLSNHVPRAREILGTQTEVIDEEGDSKLEKHLSYREMQHIFIDHYFIAGRGI